MNVYDFDKTIFPRNSTTLFSIWCLRRQPKLLKYLPGIAAAGIKLLSHRGSKRQCKEKMYAFFAELDAPEALAEEFWQKNFHRICPWYLAQKREDDVIISASPEFLLRPACSRLGVHLIATLVEPTTGKYLSPNCSDDEKPVRFRAEFPAAEVDGFWSDSLSDTPMAMLAKESWLVSGDKRTPWPGKEA